MPASPSAGPTRVALGIALACGIVALLTWLWWPAAVGLLVLLAFCAITGKLQARRIATERAGETICGFARSFDRRSVDPWVIRAVHDEYSTSCGHPIRATDRFGQDLGVDSDDLDIDAPGIAARAGRSLDHVEDNPWFDHVATVEDLVLFMNHQPRAERG